MLRFSKKTDYALLALHYPASPGEPGDVSARAIAERFESSLELLAKILQRLARHGLITAHKGLVAATVLRDRRMPFPSRTSNRPSTVQSALPRARPPTPIVISLRGCTVRDPLWRLRERVLPLSLRAREAEAPLEGRPR